LICEPDEFYPLVIQALRHEYALSGHEPWYDTLLTALQRERPLFQHYWTTHPAEPHATAARTRLPIRLSIAGEVLALWLVAEPLTSDPRFRVMSWLPADAAAVRQVARWVAE
jgi:hypothetical protein